MYGKSRVAYILFSIYIFKIDLTLNAKMCFLNNFSVKK